VGGVSANTPLALTGLAVAVIMSTVLGRGIPLHTAPCTPITTVADDIGGPQIGLEIRPYSESGVLSVQIFLKC